MASEEAYIEFAKKVMGNTHYVAPVLWKNKNNVYFLEYSSCKRLWPLLERANGTVIAQENFDGNDALDCWKFHFE